MNSKHYEVRVLPLFVSELSEILDYIAFRLRNPKAADDLEIAVYEAIRARSTCAEAFEPCRSRFPRKYKFYRIYVNNYVIFYAVIDNVMEVQSIMYNKRNTQELF